MLPFWTLLIIELLRLIISGSGSLSKQGRYIVSAELLNSLHFDAYPKINVILLDHVNANYFKREAWIFLRKWSVSPCECYYYFTDVFNLYRLVSVFPLLAEQYFVLYSLVNTKWIVCFISKMDSMLYYKQNALLYSLQRLFHLSSNNLFIRALNSGRDLKGLQSTVHTSRVRMKTKWVLLNSSPAGIPSFQNLS